MTLRVIIDAMIYDSLAQDHAFEALLQEKQDNGLVKLLSTRIENEQLAAIPPSRDIGQKSAARTERISPAVFILDFSMLDEDRLGTDEANATFNHLQRGKPKDTKDAVIGATAFNDADILVTIDKKFRTRFAAMASKTRVMTDTEFRAFLTTLA